MGAIRKMEGMALLFFPFASSQAAENDSPSRHLPGLHTARSSLSTAAAARTRAMCGRDVEVESWEGRRRFIGDGEGDEENGEIRSSRRRPGRSGRISFRKGWKRGSLKGGCIE
jgi:hypothetical protein